VRNPGSSRNRGIDEQDVFAEVGRPSPTDSLAASRVLLAAGRNFCVVFTGLFKVRSGFAALALQIPAKMNRFA
jgi:hypothetical protein